MLPKPSQAICDVGSQNIKMKKFLVGLLFLLIFSCNNDGSKKEIYNVVNEEAIISFKKEVLDSLVGHDLLVDYPQQVGIFGADRHIKFDSVYFEQYLKDISGFRWTGQEIILYHEIKEIFEDSSTEGWEEFRKRFGMKCFIRASTPFFSPDKKEAFISIDKSCGRLSGFGMNYYFRRQHGKWKLVSSEETWVS